MSTTTKNIGRITQVIGSTFDAEFSEDGLPPIYNAVRVTSNAKGVEIDLTGEIQQHLVVAASAVWPWVVRKV